MKRTGPSEKEKLALSLAAVVAAGAVWLALSLVGIAISFLMFAVLTLLLYFVILAAWRRRG